MPPLQQRTAYRPPPRERPALRDSESFDASQPGIRPLGERSWTALQRYLDRHLGDAVSLQDMARVACLSRFHFARRFRARVGTSPMEYVLAKRIELAKERLASSESSISTVAQDLGFFDQSHFYKTFSRRVGLTPGEYRTRTFDHHTEA
jgi:AraC-like DNA-binding protein